MKQATFHSMLKFASHAAAVKDVRYYLNGVAFEFTDAGTLWMIGTDGHRMACVEGVPTFGLPAQVIIVKGEDVKLLLTMTKGKKVGDVTFSTENGGLSLRSTYGDWQHTCQPVEGKYPDWRRVARGGATPAPQPVIRVNADYIAAAAKACGELSSDKWSGVTVTTYGEEGGSFQVAPMSGLGDEITKAFTIVMSMRK